MSLAARINDLAAAVSHYLRDSVVPRLTPTGGSPGQVVTRGPAGTLVWGSAGGTQQALYTDYAGPRYQYLGYSSRIVRLDLAVSPPLVQSAATANVAADWLTRATLIYS